jgi:hypothetical protein
LGPAGADPPGSIYARTGPIEIGYYRAPNAALQSSLGHAAHNMAANATAAVTMKATVA